MTTALISHKDCQLHNLGPEHPDSPIRLAAIHKVLERTGLIDQLDQITAVPVTEEQISLAHHQLHSKRLDAQQPGSGIVYTDDDTAMCPDSMNAARLAAGGVILAVNRVLAGKAENAFCAVRPPGHHAEYNLAMGFCLFNNVAIGAAHALQQADIQRVAILDFDVHHCNGTVDIFKDRPEVLVCSTFQHPYYPERYHQIDRPNIVNCPIAAHTEPHIFHRAVEEHWLPALDAHKPDMIFISAGFDAHKEDPMADLNLEEEDFRQVTKVIKTVAERHSQGRIVSVLEGGYNPVALAFSVQAHLEVLAGF